MMLDTGPASMPGRSSSQPMPFKASAKRDDSAYSCMASHARKDRARKSTHEKTPPIRAGFSSFKPLMVTGFARILARNHVVAQRDRFPS